MKTEEILSYLRQIAPEESAYEDDPVGLHVAAPAEVDKVAVCLDATLPVVEEATALGAGLIVAHHPLIYHPLKRLTDDTPSGEIALALARAGVGLYASHTNWDMADGGINDTLAELLGLNDVRRLGKDPPAAIARIGELARPMALADFGEDVEERLGCAGTSALRRLPGRPADNT